MEIMHNIGREPDILKLQFASPQWFRNGSLSIFPYGVLCDVADEIGLDARAIFYFAVL